jgi:hypothetical protein
MDTQLVTERCADEDVVAIEIFQHHGGMSPARRAVRGTCGASGPAAQPCSAYRRHRSDPPRDRAHGWGSPTTDASWPSQRFRWSYCDVSSGGSPTPSNANSSPTRKPLMRTQERTSRRAREGTRERLHNPPRPTPPPRSSALRSSHYPDPRTRRYQPSSPPWTPAWPRQPAHRADAPEPSSQSAHRTNELDGDQRRRSLEGHERALDREGI